MDIRTSLSAMWQMIGLLCQSARDAFDDTFSQFSNSTIISPLVLPEELIKAKTHASLDLMLQTASSDWLRPLTALQRITQANGFMTGLLTNYVAVQSRIFTADIRFIETRTIKYKLKGTNYTCYCHSNGSCPIAASFYLYNMRETYETYDLNILQPNSTLSGIIINCLPIQTTLASSLECFYNESCMNILFSIYSRPDNISLLDASLPSRFSPTVNIESLINELFIEEVFNETFYNKYYHECTPLYCTFIYSRRFDWVFVITTLIALLGGLYTALRLMSPYLIDFILFFKNRQRSDPIEHQPSPNIPIGIRVRNLFVKMKTSIVELNIFSGTSRDLLFIRHDRIATRLYLIILISTISILIIYTSLSVQTINKTVQSPSIEQYEQLHERYSDTLQCPCSVISIPHEDFITITSTFHQLCSSDFVQAWWYENIRSFTELQSNFFSSASSYFRTLAMFCEISNLTIVDAYRRFSSTLFVKSLVPARRLFKLETDTLINTFIDTTKAEFHNMMSLVDAVFDANQYVGALRTNIDFELKNLSVSNLNGSESTQITLSSTSAIEEDDHICYCVRNSSCNIPSIFDEFGVTIQGVRSGGCFVMDMVLQSSLLCWYDLDCLTELRTWFDALNLELPQNIALLDPSMPSQFLLNTSIEIISNDMMVEEWNSTSSFEKFYQKCNPTYCSYSYQERIHIVYIITTIIGLIGGLNIALRLVCSLLVKIFFKCTTKSNSNDATQSSIDSDGRNSSNIWTRFRHNFIQFNVFDTSSTQMETIRRERLSTRFYVLILPISILIIIIYTSLSAEVVNETVFLPSQVQYEQIAKSNFITLQCPCTQISIRQKEFTTINTSFHQICSSNFVKDLWLDYLFDDSFWHKYHRADLRVRGTAYFTLLSNLCILSRTIIDDAVQQFLAEAFISAQVSSELEFRSKMTDFIEVFQRKTLTGFSHSLQLIRDITNANMLISGYSSNWQWWLKPNRTFMIVPTSPVVMSDGCSCATRRDCVQSGGIYRSFSNIQHFEMLGWNIGCSPVETLLRSTLECLYNQTCIDTLIHYASTIEEIFSHPIDIEAMNYSVASRFKTNTTIQEIVDELFVEQWHTNVSYTSFYKQCAPTYCSYTFSKRNSLVYIVSRTLGLYGGITMSLRFLVPLIIDFAFKIRNYCRRNTVTSFA